MDPGDVTIGLAFIVGLFSFVSPCVLPLVPAYIGYMGGRVTHRVAQGGPTAPQNRSLGERLNIATHGVFFVLGFTLFFVIFGLLTTAAVSSLTKVGVTETQVTDGITRIGGTVVILFGLHVMGVMNRVLGWLLKQAIKLDKTPYGTLISTLIGIALIGAIYWLFVESWFLTLVVILVLAQVFRDALKADTPGEFWGRIILRLQTALYMDTRRQSQVQSQYGYLGSMFMGVVFSAGWTPCIGPLYGTVLTVSSTGGSVSWAAVRLTAYALGLGIPFLLTALALDQAQGVFRRLQRHMRLIEAVSGAFLLLIGALVFSGELSRISRAGAQGGLADLSFNLEDCAVGVIQGRVRLENTRDCLSDGVKEKFYLAFDKSQPVAVVEVPTASDATFSAQSSPGPEPSGGGLVAPPLDGGLEVPDLAAPEDTTSAAVNAPVGLRVGQRAPDFTTRLLTGETVSLSDYRGKVVLLNFWATWCGPCRQEMPELQTIYETRGAEGFVVLAVNYREGPDAIAGFADEFGMTFPIALDQDGRVNEDLYGSAIAGYPTSFLIDQNGVIVSYFPRAVSGSELLAALDDLLG